MRSTCLDCNCETDGERIRCPECTYTHIKKRTAAQRRIRTEQEFWQPRNCSKCGILFAPMQRNTAGQSPKRCSNCPAYTPRVIPPCARCGCHMIERKKFCSVCKPVHLAEQREKRKKPHKPLLKCSRCGQDTRLETCYKCTKAARRRQTARLRSFRDRLFTSLIHSPVDVEHILELLDSPCVFCGSTENITIEHSTPLIRGGKHEIENLVAACFPCNSSKQDRTAEEFLSNKKRPKHTRQGYSMP